MVVIQTMVNMLAVTNQEIFHLLWLQFSHLSTGGACVSLCECVLMIRMNFRKIYPYILVPLKLKSLILSLNCIILKLPSRIWLLIWSQGEASN